MTNKLIWFGLLCCIAAGVLSIMSHVSGQTISNQTTPTTSTNETTTNQLLKQMLDQQKLQTELNQDNANILATKLDIIKVELEQIKTQLSNPIPLPPPPPPGLPPPPFNATTSACKPQNDNGVLIYPCLLSTFPSGLLPPIPLPPTFPIPPTTTIPISPLTPDCINTIYGVFCPAN